MVFGFNFNFNNSLVNPPKNSFNLYFLAIYVSPFITFVILGIRHIPAFINDFPIFITLGLLLPNHNLNPTEYYLFYCFIHPFMAHRINHLFITITFVHVYFVTVIYHFKYIHPRFNYYFELYFNSFKVQLVQKDRPFFPLG
jgi:hypothetical protein